jgi:hypothetical protein
VRRTAPNSILKRNVEEHRYLAVKFLESSGDFSALRDLEITLPSHHEQHSLQESLIDQRKPTQLTGSIAGNGSGIHPDRIQKL